MENLKVDVVDTRPCSITLNVEVPKPEVVQETEKVFDDIQKSARVPGFRVGKAPMDFVRRNYQGAARERVIENLIHRSVLPALKAKNIDPVTYPVVEKVEFDFEKSLAFTVKAECHPEFKVKDYKGIALKKEIQPITDEKVKQSVEELRERNARLEAAKSDAVTPDSFVLVDYDGYLDGQTVDELKARNQLIDLSAPQSIAGFKEGLAGARKDEGRDIKVNFPDNHPNKKTAGKEIVFKVKVIEIKEKILPALDDEFAKDFGFQDLQELEVKVRESLESEEKKRQEQETEKQIVEQLLKANAFAVPESLIEDQLNFLMTRAADYFRRQGVPEGAWKQNESKMREKYREEAERNVRLSYVLNAVAGEEKIAVAEEDLKKEHDRLLESNKNREAEVEKYFAENKDRIASHLKEEKIFEFIVSKAKVKEEIVTK